MIKTEKYYSIPIYGHGPEQELGTFDTANSGLLYDKYVNIWTVKRQGSPTSVPTVLDEEEKAAKQHRFLRLFEKEVGSPDALQSYLHRRHRTLHALQGKVLVGNTMWHFVSGVGASHPLETGFVWHRTLGVPYIPGSSVKGMMRAYVEHWLEDKELAEHLFGFKSERDESSFGRIIVFDAIPQGPVQLKIDVMTPHYVDYYRDDSGQIVPSDDQSPTPIEFLTVASKKSFEFAIAPAGRHCTDDDLAQAYNVLRHALEMIGIGAKTAVGYGHFDTTVPTEDNDPIQAIQRKREEQQLAQLSPLERKLLPVRQWLKETADFETIAASPKDEIHDVLIDLYQKLKDGEFESDHDEQVVASTLREAWQRRNEWTGKLRKKQKDRVEHIQEILKSE